MVRILFHPILTHATCLFILAITRSRSATGFVNKNINRATMKQSSTFVGQPCLFATWKASYTLPDPLPVYKWNPFIEVNPAQENFSASKLLVTDTFVDKSEVVYQLLKDSFSSRHLNNFRAVPLLVVYPWRSAGVEVATPEAQNVPSKPGDTGDTAAAAGAPVVEEVGKEGGDDAAAKVDVVESPEDQGKAGGEAGAGKGGGDDVGPDSLEDGGEKGGAGDGGGGGMDDGVVDYPEFPTGYMGPMVEPNHDFTTWTAPGGKRFSEYTKGDTPYRITKDLKQQSDVVARSRRYHVKQAMKFAWDNYVRLAFGRDELCPQSERGKDNWGGMGNTLVDSLDTLWLMGLKDEFYQARDWVRDSLRYDHNDMVSVFETTIRSLGGLLSAYDWSGDEAFLTKAHDLGSRLFRAFSTASGIPYGQINLSTGYGSNAGWVRNNAILAEAGTLQLEFRYLAKAVGKTEYATTSERVFQLFADMNPANGLYPNFIANTGPKPMFGNSKYTFGAMSDSLYEYMLKIWLQGGRKEPLFRDMYDKAIQGMHDELLQTSTPSGLTYIADKNGGCMDHKMDHLVCFMGGLLALGAYTDPKGLKSERAQ